MSTASETVATPGADQMSVADAENEQTVSVIDNLNAENAATEQQRDAAVAEVARMKRKHEPEDGIIIDKVLKLSDDHGTTYMRVEVSGAGEEWPNGTPKHRLALKLVRESRINGNKFLPSVEGMRSNEERFAGYGMYQVYIGDGTFGHTCLVNFDHSGVDITAIHEPVVQGDGPLTIEEFTQPSTVTLTAGKRARTGQ